MSTFMHFIEKTLCTCDMIHYLIITVFENVALVSVVDCNISLLYFHVTVQLM